MTDFSIKYNPYTVESEFKMNGRELSYDSRIGGKSRLRLQAILSPSANWDGLLEEIADTCNDTEVQIHFYGREMDKDDLKYGIDSYTGDVKFSLKFHEGKNDEDIDEGLEKLFKRIQNKSEEIPELKRKNDFGETIFDAYEEAKDGIFDVSVIATMSSGKSTLLNAMLHREILPSENQACTATETDIIDNDSAKEFGVECFDIDGNVVVERVMATLEDITAYNKDPDIHKIVLEGDIPSVSSNRLRLCLRDTPGPNNAQDETHGQITKKIIEGGRNSLIIYVMNATNLTAKDDEHLFRTIAEAMRRGGKQSHDRFLFVINKCDTLDEEKESLVELLGTAREYLSRFGIENPILLPTNARLAVLIRKNRAGEDLTRNEKRILMEISDIIDVEKLHYEKFGTLTPTVRKSMDNQLAEFHGREEKEDLEALIHTGVPAVEETIREYIEKYAYPMKIYDGIHDILSILEELNLFAEFEKKIEDNEADVKKIQDEIKEIKKKRSNGKESLQDFQTRLKEFSFDESKVYNVQRDIEIKFGRATAQYNESDEIEKQQANRVIYKLYEDVKRLQKDFANELEFLVHHEVYAKGEALLQAYNKEMQSIMQDIQISGFDFKKLSGFSNYQPYDIDYLVQKESRVRYKEETRKKRNPKRKGFWGRFMFWEPENVNYQETVADGIVVNIGKVIGSVRSGFVETMKQNIEALNRNACSEIERYKNDITRRFEMTNQRIDQLLDEIEKKTSNYDSVKAEMEGNKEKNIWLKDMEKEIRTLLSF